MLTGYCRFVNVGIKWWRSSLFELYLGMEAGRTYSAPEERGHSEFYSSVSLQEGQKRPKTARRIDNVLLSFFAFGGHGKKKATLPGSSSKAETKNCLRTGSLTAKTAYRFGIAKITMSSYSKDISSTQTHRTIKTSDGIKKNEPPIPCPSQISPVPPYPHGAMTMMPISRIEQSNRAKDFGVTAQVTALNGERPDLHLIPCLSEVLGAFRPIRRI